MLVKIWIRSIEIYLGKVLKIKGECILSARKKSAILGLMEVLIFEKANSMNKPFLMKLAWRLI